MEITPIEFGENGEISNLSEINANAVWLANRWSLKVPKPGDPDWGEHVRMAQGHEDNMRLYHSIYAAIEAAMQNPENETSEMYKFLARKLGNGVLDKVVVEDLLELVSMLSSDNSDWETTFDDWFGSIELD